MKSESANLSTATIRNQQVELEEIVPGYWSTRPSTHRALGQHYLRCLTRRPLFVVKPLVYKPNLAHSLADLDCSAEPTAAAWLRADAGGVCVARLAVDVLDPPR